MTLRSLILGACLAGLPAAAPAQSWLGDAFGLMPEEAPAAAPLPQALADDGGPEAPPRAVWAGHRIRLTNGRPPADAAPLPAGQPETVLFFAGPKSITAGKDKGHAVAIALDPHGNLARSDVPMRFALGTAGTAEAPLLRGIADHLFTAGTEAGMQHAGATIGGAQSARAEYRVTAALESIRPALETPGEAFEPEAVHVLQSLPLLDRYGNLADDGTALQLLLTHEGGRHTLLPAEVVAGRAGARLLTRDAAGPVQMRAWLADAGSAPVPGRLMAHEAGAPAPITAASLPSIGALEVKAGPFVTRAGHVLNDGVPATLTLAGPEGTVSAEAWLRDGRVSGVLAGRGYPAALTITTPLGEVRLDLPEAPQARRAQSNGVME